MKKYFTMQEFADLRKINRNSLRYYERIGLLKPAYVDPNTKYRYYTAEQLSELDIILLCIDIGVPLKDLTQYIDNDGKIQGQELLEKGKEIAQSKMDNIQAGLKRIEYSLQYLDTNQGYEQKKGLYTRHIGERLLITVDFQEDIQDISKVEKGFSALFQSAQHRQLSPVFPAGLIVEYSGGCPKYKLFFDIATPQNCSQDILVLPEADFLCLQINAHSENILLEEINKNFSIENGNGQFIVSNMFLSKYQFGDWLSEIQYMIKSDGEP